MSNAPEPFGDFNGPLTGNEFDPTSQFHRQAVQDTCDAADARAALAEPGDRVDYETLREEIMAWDAASDEVDQMNAPDATNEPQTPNVMVCPVCALPVAAFQGSGGPFCHCGHTHVDIPEPQQPDALARLEAWLAESRSRNVEITRTYFDLQPCWVVSLIGDGLNGPRVFGYELPSAGKTTFYPSYAKAPGLAATIHAALDKADEVKL